MSALEIVGVPILCQGERLLRHFQSIDVPLKRYFIVDNSCGTDESVTDAIDEIWDTKPDHIDEVRVLTNTQNRGFPPSVNDIIRQNIDCPYWIISNFDLYVEPGEWQRILDNVPNFPNGANFGSGDDEYALFMLTNAVIEQAGMFDENFYPVYFDDNDYRYRTRLLGCPLVHLPVKYTHHTSASINSCRHYKRKNNETFQRLGQYYISKWGGPPGRETYKTPFNDPALPVDYWRYSPSVNNSLRWF